MSETWRVWRHKQNPEIRYYVEVINHSRHGWEPRMYQAPTDPIGGLVRLKSTRNVAFDDSDYALHLAPEAGLWPREAFEELYEMVGEEVVR